MVVETNGIHAPRHKGAGAMGTAIVKRVATGTGLLIDGGVIAAIETGKYQLHLH